MFSAKKEWHGSSAYKADTPAGGRGNRAAGEKQTGIRRIFAAAAQDEAAAWQDRTLCHPSSRPGQRCTGRWDPARSYWTTNRREAETPEAGGMPDAVERARRWRRYCQIPALSRRLALAASQCAARQKMSTSDAASIGLWRGGEIVVKVETKLRLVAPLMQARQLLAKDERIMGIQRAGGEIFHHRSCSRGRSPRPEPAGP